MLKVLRYFVIALLVVSCGASINPAYQKQIGDYYARQSPGSFKMSGKFIKPMPLAVGQWVMFGTTNDGKRSISKTSIIGKESDGWVIDIYSLNESKESAMQMLISGFDEAARTGNMDAIDIKWVKLKDEEGKISTMEGPMLSLTKGMYKKFLNFGGSVDVSGTIDGGSVTVPAGTFGGTAKIKSEVTFWGKTYQSDSWYHSDVPISGLVKSVGNNNENVMEILDFGTTGAKASF